MATCVHDRRSPSPRERDVTTLPFKDDLLVGDMLSVVEGADVRGDERLDAVSEPSGCPSEGVFSTEQKQVMAGV